MPTSVTYFVTCSVTKPKHVKEETLECMKVNKKRIILLCANMVGSEKFPLHFVGKATYTLYFNNISLCHAATVTLKICMYDMQISLNVWSVSTDE